MTDFTPSNRSKTASMHQKQPPPKVACSVLLVVFMVLSEDPSARAVTRHGTSSSQIALFIFEQTLSKPYRESRRRISFLRCLVFFICVRAIQVFVRGQIGELFELLGSKRFTDDVLLIEPFAEINELATMRAERPVATGKPVALFPAGRAFELWRGFHDRNAGKLARPEAIGNSDGRHIRTLPETTRLPGRPILRVPAAHHFSLIGNSRRVSTIRTQCSGAFLRISPGRSGGSLDYSCWFWREVPAAPVFTDAGFAVNSTTSTRCTIRNSCGRWDNWSDPASLQATMSPR